MTSRREIKKKISSLRAKIDIYEDKIIELEKKLQETCKHEPVRFMDSSGKVHPDILCKKCNKQLYNVSLKGGLWEWQ